MCCTAVCQALTYPWGPGPPILLGPVVGFAQICWEILEVRSVIKQNMWMVNVWKKNSLKSWLLIRLFTRKCWRTALLQNPGYATDVRW